MVFNSVLVHRTQIKNDGILTATSTFSMGIYASPPPTHET